MHGQSLKMMLTFLIPGLALLLVVVLILFRWMRGVRLLYMASRAERCWSPGGIPVMAG